MVAIFPLSVVSYATRIVFSSQSSPTFDLSYVDWFSYDVHISLEKTTDDTTSMGKQTCREKDDSSFSVAIEALTYQSPVTRDAIRKWRMPHTCFSLFLLEKFEVYNGLFFSLQLCSAISSFTRFPKHRWHAEGIINFGSCSMGEIR